MRTVIIGAGLSGLSCAYHLKKDWLILEKNQKVGGLASSDTIKGFVFDKTGHLLHLHTPATKKWILEDLLKNKLTQHNRNSWIYSKGVFTRYPFQANTYGLPLKTIVECVAGFLKTRDKIKKLSSDPNFPKWCLEVFGPGISKHFMIPYNKKLFCYDLNHLTTEWIRGFIPIPSREEVLYGALTDQKKFFGYNASFYYPKEGGIQSLSDALANRLEGQILMGVEALKIDVKNKKVYTTTGSFNYDRLINTSPLNEFLEKLEPGLPKNLESQRQKALHHSVVYNLNLGIDRLTTDKHWVYFPESKYPFYRAGVASNFSDNIAPRGMSSFYVEFARRPNQSFDFKKAKEETWRAFKDLGLMKTRDEVTLQHWNVIDPAYVIYTKERQRFLPQVFSYLESRQILSIGRYGAWKYSFMEECLLDGQATAQKILSVPSTDAP